VKKVVDEDKTKSKTDKKITSTKNKSDDKPASEKPKVVRTISEIAASKNLVKKSSDTITSSQHSNSQKITIDEENVIDPSSVIFVISGIANPERSELRESGIKLGGTYLSDWGSAATYLITAMDDTPKYFQAKADGGIIVSKDWIIDSSKKGKFISPDKYLLPKNALSNLKYTPSPNKKKNIQKDSPKTTPNKMEVKSKSSDSEVNSNSIIAKKPKNDVELIRNILKKESESKNPPITKITSPVKSSIPPTLPYSTDSDICNDEILSIDIRPSKKLKVKSIVDTDSDDTVDDNTDNTSEKTEKLSKQELLEKIDKFLKPSSTFSTPSSSSSLSLFEELPIFFSDVKAFLYGINDHPERKLIERIIIAFGGEINRTLTDDTTHIITSALWDNFLQNVSLNNTNVKIVRPSWVMDCQKARKFVPEQEHKVKANG